MPIKDPCYSQATEPSAGHTYTYQGMHAAHVGATLGVMYAAAHGVSSPLNP